MRRPTAWPPPPDLVDADRLVWAETVHPGGCTAVVVAHGTTVRLTDLDGDACAHLLVYDLRAPGERGGLAGRVRTPEKPALTIGGRLLSDEGSALATITHVTAGPHDPFFGTTDLTLFVHAAVKHGLGLRPLPPSVSFFQAVTIHENGAPVFVGSASPGASVSILAEAPLVVLVANTAHPLDPRPGPVGGPLELLAWRDYCTSPGQPSRPRMG